jgi:hypothetical protein
MPRREHLAYWVKIMSMHIRNKAYARGAMGSQNATALCTSLLLLLCTFVISDGISTGHVE